MKIGILSNEKWTNAQKNSIGSSRIRVTWPLHYWQDAEEFKIGVKYDVVVFQKAYFTEYMKYFDGVKILDLCDPDWIDGKPVVEAIELCDAVTVASPGLYGYVKKLTTKPVFYIPDRVDLEAHQERKNHEGRARSAVWFGYHHNQQVLDAVLPTIKRLGLDLTVISDLPYTPQSSIQGVDKVWINHHVKNVKYDPETVNQEIIAGGDFLINYRPEAGKFVFKSENKTLIGWAIGMPVAKTSEDFDRFMDPYERRKEAEMRLQEVVDNWTSDKSVREYVDVISICLRTREGQPQVRSEADAL